MRVPTTRPTLIALIAATSIAGALSLRAQSLGEVGRKEEERRQNVKTPSKVYSNRDLSAPKSTADTETPGQPAATATPGAPPPPAAAADDKPKQDGPVKDQKYWSGKKKELDVKLERDKVLADAMQSRINGLTADYAARSDPAQRAVIERDRQRAVAELSGLQKAIKDGQKATADLDEEARKAGVPPGWLR
jgi:hypothetical protein